MALNDWMSAYQTRKLCDLILPGSHDAGTAKEHIDKTLFGTNSNSATQDKTILQQLEIGTRFFDLRLKVHDQVGTGEKLGTALYNAAVILGGSIAPMMGSMQASLRPIPSQRAVVAHHTTGGQGAFSKISFDEVLAEAADFWRDNRSEVIIFRISHTSANTNVQDLIRQSGGNALCKATGNLCGKTLQEIKAGGGGLVCILDEVKFGTVIDQANGIHAFSKYSSSSTKNQNGICVCGCYKGAHNLHQIVVNGLKGQYEHNALHGSQKKHLWQVYWQKTYLNPLSLTGIEGGTKKRAVYRYGDGDVHGGTHCSTAYMLRLMNGLGRVGDEDFELQKEVSHKEGRLGSRKKVIDQPKVMYSTLNFRQYSLPNIFSYDFVNDVTNEKIIDMNLSSLQTVHDD